MTTALEIIEDALGLTNAIGVDQTLTADETTDGLRILNDLIENWSTQSLAVYGQANQTFNTAANQAVYTIGVGGNWNTTRPERINLPAYSTVQGVTFPYMPMTQGEYNLISYKAQPGGGTDQLQYYLYVNEYPLGLITLWPVPNAVFPITLSIDRVLSQVVSAGTSISFPQGYADAFKNNLAVKLGPRFGKKMANYPDIVMQARDSLGDIKRANKRLRVMRCDESYSDAGNFGYVDWRTGV